MCHKEYSVLSDLTNLAQNVNWLHFISLSNVAEAQCLNDQSFKQYSITIRILYSSSSDFSKDTVTVPTSDKLQFRNRN
jgi:hypothetical protein